MELAKDSIADPEILENGFLTDSFVHADDALHYIPMNLHENMTPFFYHGYVSVIQSILKIFLRNPTGPSELSPVPSVEVVLKHFAEIDEEAKKGEDEAPMAVIQSDYIHSYTDVGGKVQYALEAIIELARETSPKGRRYIDNPEVQEQNADFEKAADEEGLPKCENDLNFEIVRTKLGLPAQSAGPQWFFLTDFDSDSDSYAETEIVGDSEDDESEEAVYEGTKYEESKEEPAEESDSNPEGENTGRPSEEEKDEDETNIEHDKKSESE
ncbi:hypothetical protein QCA50_005016 [Cerrena zonata]|uniref:Uncharacterized protein n=1 Tax=Cerrena zonata TaxID=2478898 RepID=A0AAW0GNZ7_9APHY